MKVEAKVTLLSNSTSNVMALATITIENCFVVHDIRIIESSKGLFIAMPSRKDKNGNYKDIAHPISADARQQINDEILRVYYEKLGQANELVSEPVNDYGFSSVVDDDLPF